MHVCSSGSAPAANSLEQQAHLQNTWHSCLRQSSFQAQEEIRAGFTKRKESEYDAFGAGHSSTSISAGLGMAVGRDAKGKKNRVVSVIGDGAITGGMAYEAMNHAGFLDKNMIVILNDNQQVHPTAVVVVVTLPFPQIGTQIFAATWHDSALLTCTRRHTISATTVV